MTRFAFFFVALVFIGVSTTRAEEDKVRRGVSKGEVARKSTSQSRQLLNFGRSTYCYKVGGTGSTYRTRTIRRAFANFYLNRGARPGKCSTVCKRVCNHAPCRDDYILDDETCDCTNGEPLSQCSANTFCSNDKCLCLPGYRGTPIKGSAGCTDIDECATPTLNNCTRNTVCTNRPGSFDCTCARGFTGDPTSALGCTDVNECALNATICGPTALGSCENTVGGYACRCNPGYFWEFPPNGICADINECPTTNCGPNSICTNFPGSFNCTCRAGFNSTGRPPSQPCADINECTVNPNICGVNATCTNNVGNFSCACDPGYEGTPPNCVPDACTRAGVVCGVNTRCNVTTPNAPTCACLSAGYARNTTIVNGTVFFCSDINECANAGTCTETQNCFNFAGTFFCGIKPWRSCPTGQDSTCSPGLQCAQASRSDSSIVCCQNTGTCGNSKCCNDAYLEGENCPSRSDDDCEGSLQCGRTISSSTFRCCRNVDTVAGVRLCV